MKINKRPVIEISFSNSSWTENNNPYAFSISYQAHVLNFVKGKRCFMQAKLSRTEVFDNH